MSDGDVRLNQRALKTQPNTYRWLIGAGSLVCLATILLWLNTRESSRLRWWERGHYERPVWSPDSSRILYLFQQGGGPTRLVVTSKNGIQRLLDMPLGILSAPGWRSNTEISAFTERPNGNLLGTEPAILILYDLSTEDLQKIEAPLPDAEDITWHPDGDQALISFRDVPPYTPASMHPGLYKFTPEDGQFRLWRDAEWPGQIKWSPDGRYVAYLDLVTAGEKRQWQLNVIDMGIEQTVFTKLLSEITSELSWSVDGEWGLSWSPSGEWLLLNGTAIKNPKSPIHYETVSGFFFVPVEEPYRTILWEPPHVVVDFDWSPDGTEIIAVTVPRAWSGINALLMLDAPDEYR